jgi:zinc transport system substrate-binding protein
MKIVKIISAIMLLFTSVIAIGQTGYITQDAKPVIAVSILPQKYFLERIGGDRVSALVLVGQGQNPHSYDPTPKQMTSLSSSAAWILSGTDFEITLKPKLAALYPSLLIVDGTSGIKFRKLQSHTHNDDKDHHKHKNKINIDRHTWLGWKSSKIMAGHVRDILVKIDPKGKSFYDLNYRSLVKDIDSVFNNLKKTLKPLSGKTVLVFHPAFGYFLDEFGIGQEAVETGGKEPNAKVLAALIEEAKAEKTPAIFVQSQFPVNAAKTIADAVGAKVVMLDPLSADWLENIKKMGAALESSLIKNK